DFQRNLVGFQLDQDFVLLHGVADLLGPLGDGGFGDGFTEGGGEDIGHLQGLFVSELCVSIRSGAAVRPWPRRGRSRVPSGGGSSGPRRSRPKPVDRRNARAWP